MYIFKDESHRQKIYQQFITVKKIFTANENNHF